MGHTVITVQYGTVRMYSTVRIHTVDLLQKIFNRLNGEYSSFKNIDFEAYSANDMHPGYELYYMIYS